MSWDPGPQRPAAYAWDPAARSVPPPPWPGGPVPVQVAPGWGPPAPPGFVPVPPVPPPQRPHYRESRPVRWWTVLVGFGMALVFFVLVTVVALSGGTVTAFVLWLLVGVAAASGAAAALLTQGDRGAGIGAVMMSGVALSVVVIVLGVAVIRHGGLLG